MKKPIPKLAIGNVIVIGAGIIGKRRNVEVVADQELKERKEQWRWNNENIYG